MRRRARAVLMTLLMSAPPAAAGDLYACTVTAFVNSTTTGTPDAEFERRNRLKTFRLDIAARTITATVAAPGFDGFTDIYRIVGEGPLATVGIIEREGRSVIETIAISGWPEAALGDRVPATVTVLTGRYVNIWHLACEPV
jgi:hypothetical protein